MAVYTHAKSLQRRIKQIARDVHRLHMLFSPSSARYDRTAMIHTQATAASLECAELLRELEGWRDLAERVEAYERDCAVDVKGGD